MGKNLLPFFFLIMLSSCVLQPKALGIVYYVSLQGNDGNPGTLAQPWKTIQKAADTMVAGDTVLIRGGTYSVRRTWVRTSGRPDAYITFKAYPGEHPVIASTDYQTIHVLGTSTSMVGYIEFNGLTISNGNQCGTDLMVEYGHHIRMVNNVFRDAGASGIEFNIGSDYATIENNVVYNNSWGCSSSRGSGIGIGEIVWYDKAPGYHNIVRNNLIYHNWHNPDLILNHSDGNAMIVDSANQANPSGDNPPVLFENNVAFDNAGACINVYLSSNVTARNNTCYQNVSDPLITYAGEIYVGASHHVAAYNNILVARSPNQTITVDQSAALTFDYNLTFGGLADIQGGHDLVANPLFVNATLDPLTANFHLQARSPAIDLALAGQAPVIDYDGNPRPQGLGYDIGAYEVILK